MASTLNASTSSGLISSGDTSGILQLQTANTAALTIDTSANVGIGTSSIANIDATGKTLEVYGGAGGGFIHMTNSTTGQTVSDGFIIGTQIGGSDALLVQRESANMIFRTADTERMRIDSSGNLLVGTTTATAKNYTSQSANAGALGAESSGASFTSTVFQTGVYGTVAGTGFRHIQCFGSGAQTVFQVLGNGNAQNTNNSYGAVSDIKLKENIVDATPKLASIMQVKVRNYNLKSDPTHKQLGVIAQELETVFPSMIDETLDRDAEGNDLGTTTKSVKYSVFVPMLIKAIQEQQALITAQAETINALTARIVALEGA